MSSASNGVSSERDVILRYEDQNESKINYNNDNVSGATLPRNKASLIFKGDGNKLALKDDDLISEQDNQLFSTKAKTNVLSPGNDGQKLKYDRRINEGKGIADIEEIEGDYKLSNDN